MSFWRKRNRLDFKKKALIFLIVMLGLLVVQACASSPQAVPDGQQEATVGINVGQIAPGFTLFDLDGNEISLSDFRGKTVFINFWATWCPPCRAEMPEIEAVHQEYKDKGVVVIGVDIVEPESTVRQYIKRGGFTWTIVLDSTGEVASDYQIAAIPTSFFIDREGIIRAVNIGAMTKKAMEAKLAKAIR